jgi:transcriptional regulator with XRE-family HTH domain
LPQAPRKHIQPLGGPLKAFGQALREIRNERGISQERLALECDLDRTYISLIERGVQSPTIRTVAKLAEILATQPSVLVLRMEQILDGAKTGRKGKP